MDFFKDFVRLETLIMSDLNGEINQFQLPFSFIFTNQTMTCNHLDINVMIFVDYWKDCIFCKLLFLNIPTQNSEKHEKMARVF